MTLVKSIPIPLGTVLTDFSLKDPSGKTFDTKEGLYNSNGSGLMIAFMCNHCPYALAVWPRFISLAVYAKKRGIKTIAINPNIHPDYPEDSPEEMQKKIIEWEIEFPYLVDETQHVARAFDAQCTPDIYLYDDHKKLIYHGRIDDNWQDESKVKHRELKDAIDAYAAGNKIDSLQNPAMGCSIKWR